MVCKTHDTEFSHSEDGIQSKFLTNGVKAVQLLRYCVKASLQLQQCLAVKSGRISEPWKYFQDYSAEGRIF